MMKNLILPAILLLLSFTVSYASLRVEEVTECDSINNELTSKFRFLGGWDSNGIPKYLESDSDEVSQALIDFVKETLPERVNISESEDDYFGDNVQLNTELTEASEVYLTMVHEGAGWTNTLGFYTYDISNPPLTVYDIDSLVVIFPNVSQPNVVKPGDKVLLGEFPANTGIGYFLIAQGWVGDTICLKSHMVFSDKHLNTFTTEEYRQQTILLNCEREERFLLGFEDIMRPGGDNDFNDAVFYITAEPGAIDTTDIPKIPTAFISGDTTLCDENDPAIIKVELTGQAPWTIVYDNGIEEIEISNIEENILLFETLIKDTITLVSVKDKNKFGIVSGEAIIKLSQPQAILSEDHVICEGEEGQSGFVIDFEGQAPFTLTYKIGDQEITIDNLMENQYELLASVGDNIELVSMSDQFCVGIVVGAGVTVRSVPDPTLTIDGNGAICGDDVNVILDLKLGGQGPWIVNYQLKDEVYELQVKSNEYQLKVSEIGTLTFNSLEDANCVSALSTSFNIQNKSLPTAVIDDAENGCGDDAAMVNIALSGEGPWTIHYNMNSESNSSESNEDLLNLLIDHSGTFELVGVKDLYCENVAEGSIEVEIYDTPTALIGNDVTLCNDEEATIQISLTGTAPFTFVYSDGENETTITTEESLYEFTTTEFKTYTLVSINDAYCNGEVAGSATVSDGAEDIQVEIDTDDHACFGDVINLALLGDTDGLTIKWSTEGKGTLENIDQTQTSYTPAENETGVIVFYVEVSNNCAIKTISKEVTIIEELDASFSISPEKDLLTNTQITFTPTNNGYDEYNWVFDDGSSSTATISSTDYAEGGNYTVELLVKFAGCEGTGSAELEVLSKDELYIPNAFNLNAQNPENQVVKVYGNNIDDNGFSFKIVNRWGKMMYQTNSFTEANSIGWDGINNNNNEEQELNVFTYIVKGNFIEGDSFEKTGTITQVK